MARDLNKVMVSIPFIAGQWSLPTHDPAAGEEVRVSQSPSLRGSGRFDGSPFALTSPETSTQSPSLRGSGRFERARAEVEARRQDSIPFIAGQWSLPSPALAPSLS